MIITHSQSKFELLTCRASDYVHIIFMEKFQFGVVYLVSKLWNVNHKIQFIFRLNLIIFHIIFVSKICTNYYYFNDTMVSLMIETASPSCASVITRGGASLMMSL